MAQWLKANGGPLAIVVVGLGIIGWTSHIVGGALIGIGLIWFVLTVPAARRRFPWIAQTELAEPPPTSWGYVGTRGSTGDLSHARFHERPGGVDIYNEGDTNVSHAEFNVPPDGPPDTEG
jgi:hypothetical protein